MLYRFPLRLIWSTAWNLPRRAVRMAAVATILTAVCLIYASVMRDAYLDVGRTAALSTANLAESVAQDVDRNIELLDLSLEAVTRSWSDPRVRALDADLQDLVLFDNAARARDFGGIVVLDTNGRVEGSSLSVAPPPGSFSDRDYFLVHEASSNIGLFISRPFISRISQEWTIALSRRISNPDGSFGGVVAGTLRLAYFERLYKGMDLGADGGAALLRMDGTIVAQVPAVDGAIRSNVRNTDAFSRIRVLGAGSIEGQSALDGQHRIISFHRVGGLPLIQVVEVSAPEAYAGWWHKAVVLSGLLLCLCTGSLYLIIMLERELARRMQAEFQLEQLARTDALTGLPNRRRFDECLVSEWGRAIRSEACVSLLMIDADYFKTYNDTLGHPAGDEMLRVIASCISNSVHRPADLPSRIGGEEFAVILPETDEAGALIVADTIRTSIVDLDCPHPGSPSGVVTVSVGVASLRARRSQPSSDLFAGADAALYFAKAQGRNCVRTFAPKRTVALVA